MNKGSYLYMKRNLALAKGTLFLSLIISTCSLAASDEKNISNNVTPQIASQCTQLFNEADQLVHEAKKQPGTHLQFTTINNKLQQSKQQILALEINMQQKSCTKGLVALNRMKDKDSDNTIITTN